MTISNQVLETLLGLAKYNNGSFKTEKQKNFLINFLKQNGNRFFSNEVMFSNIYFIFEYDQNGLTKIIKEIEGRHRKDSQIKLSFVNFWQKLNDEENIKNNIKLKEQQIKKIKRTIINKNVGKLKEIVIHLHKEMVIKAINEAEISEDLKKKIIKDITNNNYYNTQNYVLECLQIDNTRPDLIRMKKLIDSIEEKNKILESLF